MKPQRITRFFFLLCMSLSDCLYYLFYKLMGSHTVRW